MKAKVIRQRSASYEVDIGEEFKTVKEEIKILSGKFDLFTNAVKIELEKLNRNMAGVLEKIADHEARLSTLEKEKETKEIRRGFAKDVAQRVKQIAVWAVSAGVFAAAYFGVEWAVKLINLVK